MSEYGLIVDATLDMPADMALALDIDVIPMHFELEGKDYLHYPDERELSGEDFYQALKDGAMPITAQVNPATYSEVFEKYLSQGKDVLCIVFTSGLSGSYQSSLIAKEEMEEKYPGRKIYTVDSLCASAGLGYFMYHIGTRRRDGMDIDTLRDWAEDNKLKVAHWFTVEDLFHLNRGGRLSAVEAVVGTALKIKPILTVDKEGKLAVAGKVRGTKKAIAYLADKLLEEGVEDQTVMVAHAVNEEAANAVRDMILEKKLAKEVIMTKIGPIIGTHVGPGMFALLFMKK